MFVRPYLTGGSTVHKASQDLVPGRGYVGGAGWISQVHAVTVQLRQGMLGDLDLELGSGAAHVDWYHWMRQQVLFFHILGHSGSDSEGCLFKPLSVPG